jgi:hypothetical protein
MKSLLQNIKDTCEIEFAVCEDEPPETVTDGIVRRGRLEFAKIILRQIEKAEVKPIYYNITVPVSEGDCYAINDGEEFSWSFCTNEDANIHIRTRIMNEIDWNEEEGEHL